jgi:hypothetical protein
VNNICKITWMRETPKSLNYYPSMETWKGTLGNDHGYSKNVKDWTIRRRVPNAAMIGNGTVSETAKVSVVNEGLINLRRSKVQSSPIGNYRGC